MSAYLQDNSGAFKLFFVAVNQLARHIINFVLREINEWIDTIVLLLKH